tara:strand:+ start:695 stop:1315 length:621 start_codon:yes stop_codon:yes gene_type:complete
MATYYASQFIPNIGINDNFNLGLFYDTNYYFTSGTIAGFASIATELETQFNGNITYNFTAQSTGYIIQFTYADPNVVPAMLYIENGLSGVLTNFPFSVVTNCTGCGSVEWVECQQDYTIDLGLTPSTSYAYTLTNGQTGIQYLQNSTTSVTGVTTWDTYLLPELYVSGNVFVLTATTGSEDVTFTYNGTEYSCMQITIVKQTNITD